jgi:hypothetical protein
VAGAVAAAAALTASDAPQTCAADAKVYEFVAVTKGNDLIQFRSDAPSTITHRVHITGTFEWTVAKRQITSLAVRPGTHELYAMDNGHLYKIDPLSGQATWSSGWVAGGTNQLDTQELFMEPAMDFEPGTGSLRVLGGLGLTFRIDPDTGQVVDADPATAGVQPDRDRLYFVDGDPQVRDINPAPVGFAFDPTHPGTAYAVHSWTGTWGWPSLVRINGFGTLRSTDKTVSSVGPQYIWGGGFGDCRDLLEIAPDGVAFRIAQRNNARGAFLARVDLTTGAASPVPLTASSDTGTEILYDENIVAFCMSPDWVAANAPALPPLPVPEPPVQDPPPPPPSIPATLDRLNVDIDLTKPVNDHATLVGSVPFDGDALAGTGVDVAVGDAGAAFVLGAGRAARDGKSTVRVSRLHRGRVRFRVRLSPADLADEVGSAAAGADAPLPIVLTLDGTRYAADVTLVVRRQGVRKLSASGKRP